MVDALFGLPRLAEVYDAFEPDRRDLNAYLDMVEEFGASSILDVGCGTGVFACLLAQRGKSVIGVDPAAASLAVAGRKPGADAVRWFRGAATTLPELEVDLVTMTGNVAQVVVGDDEWHATLASVHSCLRRGGRFVFETRDPVEQAWRRWTRAETYRRVDIPGVGAVEKWDEVTEVRLPLVTFQTTFVFESDGAVLNSESTLRFRDREKLTTILETVGFEVEEVRDASDRPGLEMVFVARVH